MTRDDLSINYWRYYRMLEEKVIQTANFAEIHPGNFKTFSNEYALLLQSIGAELDNFFKVYCCFNVDSTKNITEYAASILTSYSDIKDQKIKVIETDIELQPFENWDVAQPKKSLSWWIAFDNIKHNRSGSFSDANQENVLNILAALYLLEMKMFKLVAVEKDGHLDEPDSPGDKSRIFSLVDWELRYIPVGEYFVVIDGSFCQIVDE